MQCPTCRTSNTQRRSVIYANGTHHSSTTVTSVGGRSAYANSFSQTPLAAACSPPLKQSTKWSEGLFVAFLMPALFLVLIGIATGFTASLLKMVILMVVMFSPFWGLALFVTKRRQKFNKTVWPELFRRWSNSWLCMKCGAIYEQE